MVCEKDGWECPYCHNTYENHSDAESCAEECADVQSPISTLLYSCEMCNEVYDDADQAEICEKEHEDNNDLKYQQYLVKKNFEVLTKAGNAPGQKKLMEVSNE